MGHWVVTEAPNPYAVTTLEVDQPPIESDPPSRWVHWCVVLALPLMLIGSAAAVIDIETILASGPVMLGYGLILLFLTRRWQQRQFRWFAWTCCAFPFIVFLIIYTLQWSPSNAQVPISALCCVFTCAVSAGIFVTVAQAGAVRG